MAAPATSRPPAPFADNARPQSRAILRQTGAEAKARGAPGAQLAPDLL